MTTSAFSTLFQMSCQGTYWCHTLIEQKQSRKNKNFSKNSNCCRLHISSGCLSMMKSKISEPCAYMKCVNKKNYISKFGSSWFENAMISMINCFQYFCIKGTLKQFKDNLIVDRGTCLNKGNYYTFKCCSNVLDEIFCITDIYFLYIIITTRTNWKKHFGLCLKYLLYFIHSFGDLGH